MEEQLGWRQSLADTDRLARMTERSQSAPIGGWGRRDPGNGRLRLRQARYGKKPISDSDQSGFPPYPQCTMLGQSETRKCLIRRRQIVVEILLDLLHEPLADFLGGAVHREHGEAPAQSDLEMASIAGFECAALSFQPALELGARQH